MFGARSAIAVCATAAHTLDFSIRSRTNRPYISLGLVNGTREVWKDDALTWYIGCSSQLADRASTL